MLDLTDTSITIRRRTPYEVADLAFRLWGTDGLRMVGALLVGVLPFFAINSVVVQLLLEYGYEPYFHDLDFGGWFLGVLVLIILCEYEGPLAASFLTAYLGETFFERKASRGHVIRRTLNMIPQMVFWFLLPNPLRISGKCLPEIILLEQAPLFKKGNVFSSRQRCSLFQRYELHDGLTQSLTTLVTAVPLFLGLGWSFVLGIVFLFPASLTENGWTYVVAWHIAAWLTIGYTTTLRFLHYINARIRFEGWELELAVKTEAERLARRFGFAGDDS
ncbi:MAG: hypothetical protein D6741_10680 [Planctomycetota bacterium]|nr:MAG: hypothetical protein D6741_10680 [Planctomycetota bacterium]